MAKKAFRQSLSIPSLLRATRICFANIPDQKPNCSIPLVDHLMSGMAVFGLKYPSLLQFDQDQNDEIIRANLQTLVTVHLPII
jgi:hypothetical protein